MTCKRLSRILLLLSLASTTGCPSGQLGQAPSEPKPVTAMNVPQPNNAPQDASAQQFKAFRVEVFRISPDLGQISKNDAFWNRIDEQCVDVATADLLYRNGLRVGIAPISEFENFANSLGGNEPVQQLSIAGTDTKNTQIELKSNVPEQTIFYFDRANIAQGRAFDKSENIMNVSVEPAPRKPGFVRVSLCPMVRATRRKMQFTRLNDEYEIQIINPEIYYDLNFRVDIPPDSFLIVTASPDASRPTSVGNAFMIRNEPAKQLEDVILILPKVLVSAGPAKESAPPSAQPVKKK